MTYNIIASSSSGNCVIINDNIMIDCGISFKMISESIDIKSIDTLLITHRHGDHLKKSTIKKLMEVNRKLNVYCNLEVSLILKEFGVKHTFVNLSQTITINNKNGLITETKPFQLYHDVDNYGYKIFIKDFFDETKIIYATDTHTLDGVEAKGYDYYFLETNYTDEHINSHDKDRVIGTHLSLQQAHNFFIMNKKEDSEFIGLHRSNRNY